MTTLFLLVDDSLHSNLPVRLPSLHRRLRRRCWLGRRTQTPEELTSPLPREAPSQDAGFSLGPQSAQGDW